MIWSTALAKKVLKTLRGTSLLPQAIVTLLVEEEENTTTTLHHAVHAARLAAEITMITTMTMISLLQLRLLQALGMPLDAQRIAAVTVTAMIETTTRRNIHLLVAAMLNDASLVSARSWKALGLEESLLLSQDAPAAAAGPEIVTLVVTEMAEPDRVTEAATIPTPIAAAVADPRDVPSASGLRLLRLLLLLVPSRLSAPARTLDHGPEKRVAASLLPLSVLVVLMASLTETPTKRQSVTWPKP